MFHEKKKEQEVLPQAAAAEKTGDLPKICEKDKGITACLEIDLVASDFMALETATAMPKGVNYGVNATYDDARQTVFAKIWLDDGDIVVNVSDPRVPKTPPEAVFCLFDIGAQTDPYLKLLQQRGTKCEFKLTETKGDA